MDAFLKSAGYVENSKASAKVILDLMSHLSSIAVSLHLTLTFVSFICVVTAHNYLMDVFVYLVFVIFPPTINHHEDRNYICVHPLPVTGPMNPQYLSNECMNE